MPVNNDFITQILAENTSVTLTQAIREMLPVEPYFLTNALGKDVFIASNSVVKFDIESYAQPLAPMGYSGDVADYVHSADNIREVAVTPLQIKLKDFILAQEASDLYVAGMNPLTFSGADQASAIQEAIGKKLQHINKMIDRTIEWMFAKTLEGKYSYVNPTSKRKLDMDFKTPAALPLPGGHFWDDKTNPGNPIHDFRYFMDVFKEKNRQIEPNLVVMGREAAIALKNHPEIEAWMKSNYQQMWLYDNKNTIRQTGVFGNLEGMDMMNYSATYDEGGTAKPYINSKFIYFTNTSFWKMFFAPTYNFNLGVGPIRTMRFAQMLYSQDGSKLDIEVETHPFPAIIFENGIIKAQVCK